MNHNPHIALLVLTAVGFVGGLAVAIAAQVLWSRRRNKRRQGFPIDPPRSH